MTLLLQKSVEVSMRSEDDKFVNTYINYKEYSTFCFLSFLSFFLSVSVLLPCSFFIKLDELDGPEKKSCIYHGPSADGVFFSVIGLLLM